jgi:D-glycero-D-manno-heptose 1,7-bisphosphate phosphatase
MTDASSPRPSASRPGVIFDRDGVLNVDHGYVHKAEQLDWIPGARALMARLARAGLVTVVATNQSGVARGYYTLDQLHAFHDHMQAGFKADGGQIHRFYIAPHHEDGTVAEFCVPDHPDRKPNPGMLLKAIADFDLDPVQTLMVGDKGSDMEAAERAGVHGAHYKGGDLEAFVVEALAKIGVAV